VVSLTGVRSRKDSKDDLATLLAASVAAAAPSTRGSRDESPYVVRLQAQGDGVEESVVLADRRPISVSSGLRGLGQLKYQLTQSEYEERAESFVRAYLFIERAPQGGGVGPPGKSFSRPGSSVRVDVEVLVGVNFQG
jgi:hypothetical protein